MTVYVESNFVLEIALGQEQTKAAQAILDRADRGEITLALPAVSLTEPFSTITHRIRDSEQLRNRLNDHIRQRSRSFPHQADVKAIESAPAFLASIEERELNRLVSVIGRIYAIATVLPIDVQIYADSVAIMHRFRLSPLDGMIYATILGHLKSGGNPGPHFFISRNWRDFDNPRILSELATLDCEFIRSFDVAALRIEQRLSLQG